MRRSKQTSSQYQLGGPISPDIAILLLRCPISRHTFQGGQQLPTMVRYSPLAVSFTQAQLCNTPFCNISRNNCAKPHKNKHEIILQYCGCRHHAISKASLLDIQEYQTPPSQHIGKGPTWRDRAPNHWQMLIFAMRGLQDIADASARLFSPPVGASERLKRSKTLAVEFSYDRSSPNQPLGGSHPELGVCDHDPWDLVLCHWRRLQQVRRFKRPRCLAQVHWFPLRGSFSASRNNISYPDLDDPSGIGLLVIQLWGGVSLKGAWELVYLACNNQTCFTNKCSIPWGQKIGGMCRRS